jgi:hypothetical protein
MTSDELQDLVRLVEQRIEGLAPEIRRCRSFQYHEELKEELANLKILLSRLQAAPADVAVPASG